MYKIHLGRSCLTRFKGWITPNKNDNLAMNPEMITHYQYPMTSEVVVALKFPFFRNPNLNHYAKFTLMQ